jgi:hypothetical protein
MKDFIELVIKADQKEEYITHFELFCGPKELLKF